MKASIRDKATWLNKSRKSGLPEITRLKNLKNYGVNEWNETIPILSKGKSTKAKEEALKFLDDLTKNASKIRQMYNIIYTDEEEKIIEEVLRPTQKKKYQEKMKPNDVFKVMAENGMVPNVKNLDLSIPTLVALPVGSVITQPKFGIFFDDGLRQYRFFRASQIPIPNPILLKGLANLVPLTHHYLYKSIIEQVMKIDPKFNMLFPNEETPEDPK